MAEGRVRGFSIATKCATVDELIEKYRDRVDELSILVSAVESREIGTECAFAILLSDKSVALAGTCIVMNVFTDTNNPFKRTGMHLGIKRLAPDSESVWGRLVAMRVPSRAVVRAMPTAPTMIRSNSSTTMRADSPLVEITGTTAKRYVPMALRHGSTGSSFILPVDPPPPDEFPNGTHDEPRPDEAVPMHVEHARSEPLPLPPPPPTRASHVMSVEAYRASELPKLDVGAAQDSGAVNLHTARVSRRVGLVVALVIFLVPLLGAAAVIAYMRFFTLPAVPALVMIPAEVAAVDEPELARAAVEPAPDEPTVPEPTAPPAPTRTAVATRQPIHTVLVKSHPIAARVTVDGRFFGTTPTYVKVPANTEVEIELSRPGFKPVTYSLVSKKRTDRVVVWLQRARGGKK
jgi:hypothetical protein